MAKLNYLEHTDEVLVALTLTGDQNAYEMLVTRYQKSVMAVARRITRDEYLAEDASQEAFVSAWVKLDCLRDPARFGAWVRRIAKNCAVNVVTRLREYVSFDVLENAVHAGNCDIAEENEDETGEYIALLHESIGKLPAKVRKIITLHYFEGLSVAEIATRLGLAQGTVKWQLHDGRERIRKDLGVMENRMDKTLVERVMLEVEKLKLWRLKNNKKGFSEAYRKTLCAVEELPECREKNHAMADVLLQGYWWLPGQKNDEVIARMKEYALNGHNDEVMESVCYYERRQMHGDACIEYIRDVQIPFLEQHGFVKSQGAEWFWLAFTYFEKHRVDEGFAALEKVLELLTPKDAYYANALSARRAERAYWDRMARGVSDQNCAFHAIAETYRIIDGEFCFWSQPGYSRGGLYNVSQNPNYLLYYASRCNRRLFIPGASVGETMTDDEGNTLAFVASDETVKTPCGTFEHCELWETVSERKNVRVLSWYCDGVGLVKQQMTERGKTYDRLLAAYTIVGGQGRLPCAVGNVWEYVSDDDPSCLSIRLHNEMTYAGEDTVIFAIDWMVERIRYDPNRWEEMALQMRSDYWKNDDKGDSHLADVRPIIERCEALASTPYQKAHTRLAASAMRRILETDDEFSPDRTHSGHWNFFDIYCVEENTSLHLTEDNRIYSFEWKNMGGTGDWGAPLFFGDVINIWYDATDCLWNPEWKDGFEGDVTHTKYGNCTVKTRISCRAVGSVTTAADTFTDCLEVSLEIEGMSRGLSYRNGTKKYYFAPGVGIVRTVQDHKDHTLQGIYDLVAYEGCGEGYLPLCEGMTRRYEAQYMRQGYIGWADYAVERDEQGNLCLLKDQCGIKKL